jgi:hypothetical protein
MWLMRGMRGSRRCSVYSPRVSELLRLREQRPAPTPPQWLNEHFRSLCQPTIDIHGPGRRGGGSLAGTALPALVRRRPVGATLMMGAGFSCGSPVRPLSSGDTVARSALEQIVSSMTRGSVAETLRLVEGRPTVSCQSVWARLLARMQQIEHLCSQVPTAIAERHEAVIDALRRTRRTHRHERRWRPVTPMRLRADLAIAELAAVIMRHGPPEALVKPATLPG